MIENVSVYPIVPTDTCVDASALLRRVHNIFEQCGMSKADALLLSGSLVAADLRGVHSHGVLRVPDYVGKLTKHGVDPRGRPRFVKQRGAVMVVDGANAMG